MGTIDEYWVQVNNDKGWGFIDAGKDTIKKLSESSDSTDIIFSTKLTNVYNQLNPNGTEDERYTEFKNWATSMYFYYYF